MSRARLYITIAGILAGIVNGFFGAGGGMILVPLLSILATMEETSIFPSSISIILPICLISLMVTAKSAGIAWINAIPYLLGSGIGGIFAGIYGKKVPVTWMHRCLGGLILWGGIQYLC